MNTTMDFYFGSLALYGFSSLLFQGTSPFSELNCITYDKRRTRRLIAKVVLVVATFCLALGIFTQFVASNP